MLQKIRTVKKFRSRRGKPLQLLQLAPDPLFPAWQACGETRICAVKKIEKTTAPFVSCLQTTLLLPSQLNNLANDPLCSCRGSYCCMCLFGGKFRCLFVIVFFSTSLGHVLGYTCEHDWLSIRRAKKELWDDTSLKCILRHTTPMRRIAHYAPRVCTWYTFVCYFILRKIGVLGISLFVCSRC